MSSENRRSAGFKDRTRVRDARTRLLDVVEPHGRVETVSLERADERVLAQTVYSPRPAPHYSRAAMDGYAVRAADTFGASDRAPVALRVDDAGDDSGKASGTGSGEASGTGSGEASGTGSGEASGTGSGEASGTGSGEDAATGSGGRLRPDSAIRVHTGSELPAGADAVVMIEDVETVGDEIEVFDAVAEGENVAPVGEDVTDGQHLYDPGHRLRPSDLGLLKSVGFDDIEVYERPRASVVPTGDELVQADPDPGEVVETNGQTVTQLVARWGGRATYREVVPDDPDDLRSAFRRDLDHDLIVTTGGSSVGERDRLPEVIADLGEVLVHGVALKPGHPVALGVVEETPVFALPGYPVACMVNAVQFLRPALQRAVDAPCPSPPSRTATLDRKVSSEPGTRTFVRVRMTGRVDEHEDDRDTIRDGEDDPVAVPTRASGAGVLSSVALADGWVVVPEGREGYAAGTTVEVEHWEWSV